MPPDLSIEASAAADARQIELPLLEELAPELRTAFAPEPSTVHAIATSPAEAAQNAGSAAPPRPLPDVIGAEPLSTEARREDAELMAFIRDELETLAASEHDIWYETLKGLAREDATEILRLWKLTREFAPSARVDVQDAASLPVEMKKSATRSEARSTPRNDLPSAGQSLHDADLRRICHLNLANAATPGFKRREIMVFERSIGDASPGSITGSPLLWLNTSQGKVIPTNRSFDCAIDGPGFFQVRCGDELFLTRCGRFVLDQSRRLALPRSHGEPCPLEPAITLPERCDQLAIDPQGAATAVLKDHSTQSLGTLSLVQVFDPSELLPVGDNLLKSTAASGEATPLDAGHRGKIVQGSIEQSNVDPADERRKLETLSAHKLPL